jgi:hypothetical protein
MQAFASGAVAAQTPPGLRHRPQHLDRDLLTAVLAAPVLARMDGRKSTIDIREGALSADGNERVNSGSKSVT